MAPKKDNQKTSVKLLYFDKNSGKTINRKKIIGLVILLILLLIIVAMYIVYANNEEFRNYVDKNILKKEINENNLQTIQIEDYDKSKIFAYSKYIAILKDNTLKTYNSSAKQEAELKIEISNPIINTNGKNLIIAEQNSSKIYMITDNTIRWEKNLEGNISRINVNANGYTSVILTGTAYKSVIILFDDAGNELFKTYLSSTIAVDTSISDDNKYLSFAEVNTSGTLIQSNIKVISIDKAKESREEAIIYTYNAQLNSLILNIKYQKTRLICEYDDSIHMIKDNVDTKIADIDTKTEKITFSSINLNDYFVKVIEENADIFSTKTTIKIINPSSLKENIYNFDGVTKEMYSDGEKIALNLGSEIHFINTNGWLIKKYTSTQEVRKIAITNEIAGIVYRDKIEVIKL